MKKILSAIFTLALLASCDDGSKETDRAISVNSPFLDNYGTPFEVPNFEKISTNNYIPTFSKGIEEQKSEIQIITSNKEASTFENTILKLEYSGALLDKVSNVFYNLKLAETNEEINKIASDLAPILSQHSDDILMNEKLFHKVKEVYDKKDQLTLSQEQKMLLEKTYKSFERSGVNLSESDKSKLRKVNTDLSYLSLKFGENILSETNKFKLVIEDEKQLSGLPEGLKQAAAEQAEKDGEKGKWLFTIHKPILIPFLTYSDKRELREKMFKAYVNQGNNNDSFDNKEIIEKIVNLRVEKANLLGYSTWANYVLDENMAKTPENVRKLLNELMEAALPKAKSEAYQIQKMIKKEGKNFKIEPWDWWYYSEKVKKEKFAFDEEELKPYLKLENVRDGAFKVANKLYGLKFEERKDIKPYHGDVEVWELKEVNGEHVGIIYLDYFPRPGKRGGAWMNSYRKQSVDEKGNFVTPIITNVCNFTKPVGDTPSLLSIDEVTTLFHEFGHALHGLLSKGTYRSLTGTAVSRDFVELPSQLMENWAFEPEVLALYAKHYKTGELVPESLIAKMKKASKFNQGFKTVEYLSAALLDMDWHTLQSKLDAKPNDFEATSMKNMNMIPEIVVRYRSPYFQHIFAGGYSSGYYAYVWAEILDADAFQVFKENGLFNKEIANKFRINILEKGGSEEGMNLYLEFRGKEPSIQALKERKGLI